MAGRGRYPVATQSRSATHVKKIMKKHHSTLQPYVLNGITEITEHTCDSDFRRGAYASIVELDWYGTRCVGKILHETFFDAPGRTDSGMEYVLKKFCQEIKLLSDMKHPNIVQFFGICYSETTCLPILVMESLPFSLTKFLETQEKGLITDSTKLSILFDVSKGLVYLHEVKRVAHRDLSSNNVLLTSHMCAKIADLGSARVLDKPGGWSTNTSLTMQPGTQDFMPPEALEDPPQYTVSVDAFSFGCVIIHLFTHQWPSPIGKTVQGKPISEYKRRQKFISIMGKSHFLIPLVKLCLDDEDHTHCKSRPTSKEVVSFIQGIIKARLSEKYVHSY